MTLEQLRALLLQKTGALGSIRQKAMAETSTQEDLDALDAALKEIEGIEKKIELAEKAEAVEAKASKPAGAPAGGDEDQRVPAQPERKMAPDQKISLIAAAVVKSKGLGVAPIKVLADEGYAGFAAELQKTLQQKSVNTTAPANGGVLVPQALSGEIVELLRPETTFLQGGPKRVQLVGGQFKQPRGATGATASYVGQGAKKPVSDPTFDSIDMKAKKLAGIVLITQEAQKWSLPNIEAYVRDDLRSALGQTMDLNAYLGTGTGDTPLGILNIVGVGSYDASGLSVDPKKPTIAEVDAAASKLTLHLTRANVVASQRWAWLMEYRTLEFLKNMRVGGSDGDYAYPSLHGATPTWKGYRVLVTNQVPSNLGTGTDETLIALIDFTHVLFGDEEDMVVKMSEQATIDVSGTLVHLFQQNMFAILAEMQHDFGLRHKAAVAKLTKVRWGA